MNRKGAEYVCTLKRYATPRSPFFARCQPRSTSFSSGKIAICNRANLSNRLTTSLCRKRGAANRRIDGIVMNDSRAQSPILPGHSRPPPRWYRSRSLAVLRSGGGGLSHRGIHDHPKRFHRIRACRAFLSFFSPFFRLPFHGGSPSNRWRLSSPLARSFFFVLSFLFFFVFFFFIRTPANELKGEAARLKASNLGRRPK